MDAARRITADHEFPPKLVPALWNRSRYKVLHGGRGSTKSWSVARWFLIRGHLRPIRVLCCREIQLSITDSVHQLLCDQIVALGLSAHYRPTKTSIEGANGTMFAFAGLRQQDVGKIKSFEGFDYAWVEEAQAVTRKSWEVLTPTIRRPNSEIWITFNPELETDEVYARFVAEPPDNAIVIQMNWRDNPWFPEVLNQERLDCKRRDPEGYKTIWEGKCRATVAGAIYATELELCRAEGRITRVPYEQELPVDTIWDLGVGDSTAIWFVQVNGSEWRFIDYLEDSGEGLPYYAKELEKRGYVYRNHWAPHDIQVRELGSGRSRIETAAALGIKFKMVPRAGSGDAEAVEERIHAARMVFPRCWFDKDKTRAGVSALSRYRRAYNQALDEFKATPVHDQASHGADAFGHAAVSLRTRPEIRERPPTISLGAGGWMR